MITPCPHCQTDLELDAETLTALGDAPAFTCPVCQGEVPNPALESEEETVIAPCVHCGGEFQMDQPALAALRNKVVFPCPLCSRMLPVSMFRITDEETAAPVAPSPRKTLLTPGWKPPAPGQKKPASTKAARPATGRSKVLLGMNRNLLIIGAAALLALGGLGMFLASEPQENVTLTREDRVREIVRNRFFSDLIAAGKADEKALLSSWEIRPYWTGFVGVSGDTATWKDAAALAKNVGATVFRLDPPDAGARTAFLNWIPFVTEELAGESHWLFDHGQPKVISASAVNRVSTLERKRRVILHWDNPDSTP